MIEDLRNRLIKALVNEDGKYHSGRWQKSQNKDLKKEIEETKIGDAIDFYEKIWLLLNDKLEIPKCKYCGNRLKMKSMQQGYINPYCSIKCSANCPEYKKNREEKCMQKHGVKSHLSLKSVIDKRKQTTMDLHGVEFLFQSKEFRDKSKETSLIKYGTENPACSAIVKAKAKKTFEDKYGCHPKSTEAVKQKCKDNLQQKYGVDNVYQREDIKEKIKQNNLIKHGVEHASQRASTLEIRRQKFIENILPNRLKLFLENESVPIGWEPQDYENSEKLYEFTHLKCSKSFYSALGANNIKFCPYCSSLRSNIERAFSDELEKHFNQSDIKLNDRFVIFPKELDVVIQDRLAIEVNGIYWHSAKRQGMTLLEKTELCSLMPLMHFWEYELQNKMDFCINLVKQYLGKAEKYINAKDCELVQVSKKRAERFLNNNHINGFEKAEIYWALTFENKIVYIISILNKEVIQFSNKQEVFIENALSYILSKIDIINAISVKVDNRFHNLEYQNFIKVNQIKPNNYWIKGDVLLLNYTDRKLINMLKKNYVYDENLSLVENMYANKWLNLQDCGFSYFKRKI